jgi:hypothetical protein
MKFNRDIAIKGALVVAILIVIGVSAHLYAKQKNEHFDFEKSSLTGFSKGEPGKDGEDGEAGEDTTKRSKGEKGEKGAVGDSAFNISIDEKRWTGGEDNKSGWLNSLKGEPGLTGAAGKNWNNANVWADLPGGGVTAAAGDTKVNVADIVDYIITKLKTENEAVDEPLGSIQAYHIGFKHTNNNLYKLGNELLEKGWVICDGSEYSDKDGIKKKAPDLRGRFLYQKKDLRDEVNNFDTGMGESEHSDGDVASGKIQINAKQMPRHRHIVWGQTHSPHGRSAPRIFPGHGMCDWNIVHKNFTWNVNNQKRMRGEGAGPIPLDETMLVQGTTNLNSLNCGVNAIQMSYYSGGDREKGGIYTAEDATKDKEIYPVDGDKTYKLDKTKGAAIDIRPPYFSVIYIMKVA